MHKPEHSNPFGFKVNLLLDQVQMQTLSSQIIEPRDNAELSYRF